MTNTAPRTKTRNKNAITAIEGAQPPRLRAPLRRAIDEIVWKGRTQRDAAKEAGMNETALGRALQRPHVAAYVEALKAQSVIDADKLKTQARAIAIQTGIELLRDAKSEAVKARMVEFFAGEAKAGTSVAVQVNVDRGGYEYARPGAQVVEIIDHANQAPDYQSDGDDGK